MRAPEKDQALRELRDKVSALPEAERAERNQRQRELLKGPSAKLTKDELFLRRASLARAVVSKAKKLR